MAGDRRLRRSNRPIVLKPELLSALAAVDFDVAARVARQQARAAEVSAVKHSSDDDKEAA